MQNSKYTNFQVSVVIPVFNSERFLKRAVNSALQQPEVFEIILIEDNSQDNSLSLCKDITNQYDKVRLFQHSDKQNHGAGESRNLGIKKSSCNFIAFLDSDDYYEANRFKDTKKVFVQYPNADGVYECLDSNFENERLKAQWLKYRKNTITVMHSNIDPNDLFLFYLKGKKGSIHLDTLTIKKEIVQKVGYFSHKRLAQDYFFILKLAACSSLFAGNLKSPVAIRYVHQNNRITKSMYANLDFMIKNLYEFKKWYQNINCKGIRYNKIIILRIFKLQIDKSLYNTHYLRRKHQQLILISYFFYYPYILLSKYAIKYFYVLLLR